MGRWIIVGIIIGMMAGAMAPSFALQGPGGRGASVVLCVAEQLGLGNSHVNVEIDDQGVVDGIGEADVTITHGTSGSTHHIVYSDDNDDGFLDCGDRILSIS